MINKTLLTTTQKLNQLINKHQVNTINNHLTIDQLVYGIDRNFIENEGVIHKLKDNKKPS